MAEMSMTPVRLMGFAGLAGIEKLRAAMAAIDGPPLRLVRGPAVAALVQDEPATSPARRGRKALLTGLQTVQRRLEVACQAGPFLPMDPGAAICPAASVDALLDLAWDGLATCLTQTGDTHQWDIVIRWAPDAVLAPRRAALAEVAGKGDPALLADAVKSALQAEHAARCAALLEALHRHVLAVAPVTGTGNDTEIAVTVLVPRGQESHIELALGEIPAALVAGADADLRGPMPPVSFHAVRLASVDTADMTRAWRLLSLPEKVDQTLLHRQWRAMAAASHPDRHQGASAEAFTDITEAYRLLRPLLDTEPRSLRSLLRHEGHRLVLPACAPAAGQNVEHAA